MTSFLTEAQRAALDSALAAKQSTAPASIRRTSSGHHGGSGISHGTVGDRKSRSTKGSGAAKKGGAGGRYTWGKLLADQDDGAALDRRDPNYDSDEEETPTKKVVYRSAASEAIRAEVQAYKEEIKAIVEEFFLSGDVQNVAESLADVDAPEGLAHYFIATLLRLAMDRKDREREMASGCLSQLYLEALSPEQVHKGFQYAIDRLEDTALDVPDAADVLALFIARAGVDDILPYSFAAKAAAGAPEGSQKAACKAKVEFHLSARHAAERLLRCWGHGGGQTHAEAKQQITTLLNEYLASADAEEASRCLRELGLPFFHHELAKQALWVALTQEGTRPKALALLKRLAVTGELTEGQLLKAFQRLQDGLEDARLDFPAAPEQWPVLLADAEAAGLVETGALSQPGVAGMAASSPGAASNGTPNGAQKGPGVGVAAYKAAATAAVKEYFDSCDAGEVARQLLELGEPGLGPLAVKIAVVLALDRKDRERELMQVLLTELHPRVIDNEQMAEGFTRLLKSADDLVLDIPDAVHLLALTTARAIVDEVLPPVFLESVLPTLPAGGLGVEVVKAAGSMLSQRHAAERLQMCWRGGGLTVEAMRGEMKTAVQDYLNSKNVDEVAQVFAEMNIPSYGHELVKVALEAAFAQPSAAGAVGDLLRGLAGMNTLNGTQLAKGLSRVQAQLPDEALDAPGAPDIFAGIIDRARKEGWLPAEYAA